MIEFINTNHRNPSRHRIDEHLMFIWLKANRYFYAGKLEEPWGMKSTGCVILVEITAKAFLFSWKECVLFAVKIDYI